MSHLVHSLIGVYIYIYIITFKVLDFHLGDIVVAN